jgi:hypothetical protein
MKRIIRLTESDLVKLVKRVINEQVQTPSLNKDYFKSKGKGILKYEEGTFPILKEVDGFPITDEATQWDKMFKIINVGGRGFMGGDMQWVYSEDADDYRGGGAPGLIVSKGGQSQGTLIFK